MSRVRPRTGPTISLFPFLAVLLCTMGSLLVLLVLFSRSASRVDAAAAEAARQQQEEELAQARDELAWRLDQLQAIRSGAADDLSRARMQLAGIEDAARALVDELAALERLAAALEEGGGPAADDEEIRGLERRLAEARGTLDAARKDAASRPPAYAVVPYEGAGGTHRRPLYVECCVDGVFLQPEGIRLGPADFEGPPGPGNPLASALRAAREHLARGAAASGDPAAQPYPLLLVRPTGVMAYYAAREALQSWGSEFGYQFVDEDWTLTYPAPDPALAEAEMRAVEEARQRMQWLAQVRPARRAKPTQQFRAAPTRGGVMSEGGPSVLGDQSRWDWTEEQASAGGGRPRPGRGVKSGGDDAQSHGDPVLGGGVDGGAVGSARGGDARGEPSRYSGPTRFYAGASDPQAAANASASGAGHAADAAAPGGGGLEDGAAEGSDASGTASAAGANAGLAGGSNDLAGNGADGGSAGSAGAGGLQAGDSQAAGSARAGESQAGGGGAGPSLPGMAGTQAGAATATFGSGGGSGSLAGRRGSNWASLATQDRPIPLTRPIRLECAAQEFRILGAGGRVQSRIPIGTHTASAVDPLVREVHAEVGRWGLAGDRMYWKPLLVLSATADGQGRRDDLERLLVDSGIDTRRSETRDRVHPLPPVVRTGAALPVR